MRRIACVVQARKRPVCVENPARIQRAQARLEARRGRGSLRASREGSLRAGAFYGRMKHRRKARARKAGWRSGSAGPLQGQGHRFKSCTGHQTFLQAIKRFSLMACFVPGSRRSRAIGVIGLQAKTCALSSIARDTTWTCELQDETRGRFPRATQILPKTGRLRAKSEMTENAVECAVCGADSRPSRASIEQSAWSRNSRARFRARRLHIRLCFRSSAVWAGFFPRISLLRQVSDGGHHGRQRANRDDRPSVHGKHPSEMLPDRMRRSEAPRTLWRTENPKSSSHGRLSPCCSIALIRSPGTPANPCTVRAPASAKPPGLPLSSARSSILPRSGYARLVAGFFGLGA